MDDEGSADVVFREKKLQFFAAFGRNEAVSIPVETAHRSTGTGVGPDLIPKRKTEPAWHPFICPIQSPKLVIASKRVMQSRGATHFTVLAGESRAMVPFFVVQNTGVSCVLGISFTDHRMEAIFLGLWKAVIHPSLSVSIAGLQSSPS